MNSTQPDEPYRQLSLWDNVADSPQNIQRDDLVEASTEKSALGETQTLIEDVVDDTILEMAWARVKSNRGAPGPDGITLAEFPDWFRPQWSTVRQQLIDGSYRPSPARRVTMVVGVPRCYSLWVSPGAQVLFPDISTEHLPALD